MSRIRKQSEYEKTFAFRFFRWLGGEKDAFVGNMEMQPQKEYVEEEATIEERMKDRKQVIAEAYDDSHNMELRFFNVLYKIFSIVFCVALVFVLILTVSHLPAVGDPDRPTSNIVSETYITDGLKDTGAVNIVTGMILSYRAFDTFGETNVLFIATCCVMILLMIDEDEIKKNKESNDRGFEPKNDVILQVVARFLVPVIFLFGIYIILNGHISPGGGFSGGAMIGAGLILYVAAFGFEKTEKFFNEHVYKVVKVTALLCYGCIVTYYFLTGANGLECLIPLGEAGKILSGGITLPINIFVGSEVACTMYAFYALFRRGGL
ncbi:MAG: hypothetical protein J6A92_04935 [Lachnospiraceae bacterium]|nr:hypothetical protein [Lachnospiraceae bacterium]